MTNEDTTLIMDIAKHICVETFKSMRQQIDQRFIAIGRSELIPVCETLAGAMVCGAIAEARKHMPASQVEFFNSLCQVYEGE